MQIATMQRRPRGPFPNSLMKSFFRSSVSQERLNSVLALLLIENERAQDLNFRNVVQQFASAKVSPKIFNFIWLHIYPPITRKRSMRYTSFIQIKLRFCNWQGCRKGRIASLIGNC